MQNTPDHSNRPHTIMTADAVQALPGVLSFERKEIAADSFVDVSFTDLRPEVNYIVYSIADSTNAKQVPLTDEDKAPVSLVVSTTPEVLEIEWNRLSTEMQITEIKAVLRTNWLKEAAAAHYPPIVLPVGDDIHLGDTALAEEAPPAPVVDKFGRSPKGKKKEHVTAPPPSAGDEAQKNVWRLFLEWWVGQSPMVTTKIRSEFHLKEALFAAQQEVITRKYLESGVCKKEEIAALTKYAATMEANLAAGKVRKETMPMIREFRRFRSWYKGGQVLQDFVEKKSARLEVITSKKISCLLFHTKTNFTLISVHFCRCSGVVGTPVAGKRSHSTEEVLRAQLQVRSDFLQSRVDDVEACKDAIRELVELYGHALDHRLKDDDLLFNRASLTPQVIYLHLQLLVECLKLSVILPLLYRI